MTHGGLRDTADFREVLLTAAGEAARKTQRTRFRLLAAIAGQLLDGVPRGELRVADVTAKAGLAHGTFYRYFSDVRQASEVLIRNSPTFFTRSSAKREKAKRARANGCGARRWPMRGSSGGTLR